MDAAGEAGPYWGHVTDDDWIAVGAAPHLLAEATPAPAGHHDHDHDRDQPTTTTAPYLDDHAANTTTNPARGFTGESSAHSDRPWAHP